MLFAGVGQGITSKEYQEVLDEMDFLGPGKRLGSGTGKP